MANQMAKKNYFHQYPVANELWSTFDPNRISGSTSSTGLLHSLTSPLKQTSSFECAIKVVKNAKLSCREIHVLFWNKSNEIWVCHKNEVVKMWNRPVEKYLWQFWNKSNRKWVHWESGHLWGAARSALATFWIDLHKFGQCKRLTCHTAQGIELCHVGLQSIFTMLEAVEEKLPALEVFGSPTYFLK